MELLVAVDDYCVEKILCTALFAEVDLSVTKGCKESELLSLHPQARSLLLKTSFGYLTQHSAIMRYIANLKPSAELEGRTAFDSSQVDSWIEFSWKELDVAIQVLIGVQSILPEFKISPEDKKRVETRAKEDIAKVLAVLDERLSDKTYFVGENLTIADISFCCSISAIIKLNLYYPSNFTNVHRWFMTVYNQPKILFVIGELPILNSSDKKSTATEVVAAGNSVSLAYSGRWDRKRIRVKELLKEGVSSIDKEVVVKGWVRTTRSAEKGAIIFVELTDGSTVRGLQLVLNSANTEGFTAVEGCGGVGASISVRGKVVSSPAKGQEIEVHVTHAELLGAVYGGDNGEVGGKNYPMAKKQHGLEFLREKAHLRPRSKMFSSAMRMRHAMAFATHKFFNDRGFLYIHTPLITGADCEGAGEQFAVTTLLPEQVKASEIPLLPNGQIDYTKDFFGRRCCLTVSGQLNVETHACALSDVYTFGPTFRAENSHTSRHLAEFWMIEPEICFADLADDAALAEDYIKYCAQYALENCAEDLAYFEEEYPFGEKGLRQRLRNVVENDFAQVTYTEAVALLQAQIADGKVVFESYPSWGDDLGSEHERYITEKVFQKPTIVTNYPKGIKAFYMRLNDDDRTVAAMDILVPKIGEIIGGSQREDRLDVLERRCQESGLDPKHIWWYGDLRRYGSVPHAGFGLGFERLIMFVTGLENIRDVIPFPRVPGHAEF